MLAAHRTVAPMSTVSFVAEQIAFSRVPAGTKAVGCAMQVCLGALLQKKSTTCPVSMSLIRRRPRSGPIAPLALRRIEALNAQPELSTGHVTGPVAHFGISDRTPAPLIADDAEQLRSSGSAAAAGSGFESSITAATTIAATTIAPRTTDLSFPASQVITPPVVRGVRVPRALAAD
jgi:hypothetical protein